MNKQKFELDALEKLMEIKTNQLMNPESLRIRQAWLRLLERKAAELNLTHIARIANLEALFINN